MMYQLFQLINNYLEYSAQINVSINFQQNLKIPENLLPGITVCFDSLNKFENLFFDKNIFKRIESMVGHLRKYKELANIVDLYDLDKFDNIFVRIAVEYSIYLHIYHFYMKNDIYICIYRSI